MPVVSLRGSAATYYGVPVFSPLENVYDAGIDTWCAASGNEAPKYIDISGHGFSTYFNSTATINSITVSLRGYTSNTARWAGFEVQVFISGVAVGTAGYAGLGTGPSVFNMSLTGVTSSDLLNPAMTLRVNAIRGFSLQTGTIYVDYAEMVVDYTPGTFPPGLDGYWGAIPVR